jgi:hypothetical protein
MLGLDSCVMQTIYRDPDSEGPGAPVGIGASSGFEERVVAARKAELPIVVWGGSSSE